LPPSKKVLTERQHIRLATLRKLHAQLDLRDELRRQDEAESAVLADLHTRVAALAERWDELERRVRAACPAHAHGAATPTAASAECQSPETERGDNATGSLDMQQSASLSRP